MAKLFYSGEPGLDLYGYLVDDDGEYWSGSAFEVYNNTHWADYAIALTENGASGHYSADVPEGLAAGQYVFGIREQGGENPAEADENLPNSILDWTGEAVYQLSTAVAAISAYGDAHWVAPTTSAIATALLVTPANKLATDGSGYVTTTGASNTAAATAVWASASRTLSSYGTLVADVATAVWGAATRTLSAFAFTVVTSPTTTALKAILDKLDSMLTTSPYKFTADALENAPVGGDATEAKQDTIIAAIPEGGIPSATQTATAVLAAAVDGDLTLANAIAQIRSGNIGKIVRTDDDPSFVYDFYNHAGDEVLFTMTIPPAGTGRTVEEAA
ncbi:MAG: hypothetical protein AMXMBFR84_25960 [Candidatus Hydrogenedentota bacterium]